MHSKHELLKALRQEQVRWERLLADIPEEQLVARQLPSGLSIKDVVAHLGSWQQLSIARLEAATDNRDPRYTLGPEGLDPDDEENLEQINAWIHTMNLDRPWSDVYQQWEDGFDRFLQLAEALHEEALMQPARYPWLKDAPLSSVLVGSYEHHHIEHYEPLAEWLGNNGHPVHAPGSHSV